MSAETLSTGPAALPAGLPVPVERRLPALAARSRAAAPGGSRPQTTVVFIHGLWLHATSWQAWQAYFSAAGYRTMTPGWPDFPASVAETRMHPEFMYDQTLGQAVQYYSRIVRRMRPRPVVIGHSFGGLLAQQLLDRRLVSAAIAIDPAPIKGVLRLPFAQLRSALPVLSRPLAAHGAVSLKPRQFRYSFANRLSESEAAELYERWTIPAPAKPLWQAAVANLSPHAQNAVDVQAARPPLLLMAGLADHTVPPQTVTRVRQLYQRAPAVTDLKEWPGRGHSLVIDHGWLDLADYALEWLQQQGIRPQGRKLPAPRRPIPVVPGSIDRPANDWLVPL